MRKWFTLSFLSLAFFFYMADRALFGLLVIPIQKSTGLSDVQIGFVDTAMFWVYAILVPFAGMLGDRFDRRKIIAIAILLWGAATAMTGFVGGFLGFIVVRSVLATGVQTLYTPCATALIAEEHKGTRTIALSVHQAAMYIGLMSSGAIVAAALAGLGGWQGVYFLFGGLTVVVGIVFWFAVVHLGAEYQEGASTVPRVQRSIKQGMMAFFGNPAALCAGFGYMTVLFVTNAYAAWAPKFVASKFSLGVGASGKGVMFYHNFAALLAILAAGFLTDALVKRNAKSRLFLQIGALVVGAPLLVFFGFAPSVGLVWAAIAAWGIARGLFQSNAFASVFDVVPPESRASAVGFLNVLTALVCSVSPLVMGALSQRYGIRGFEMGFAGMGGLLILGAVALLVSCVALFEKHRIVKE